MMPIASNTGRSRVVDVGHLLDHGPWTMRQKSFVGLAALAVVFDGLDIQLMGFAIPSIAKEWGLVKASFASVLAGGLFGVALGSALGGLLGDRVGRRAALITSVVCFGAMTLGMAGAHSLTVLLLLRFGAGLGIGGALPNAATLTAEFTPVNRRALATTLTIVCIPLGGLVAGVMASSLLGAHSWRMLFVIGGAAPLLLALLLFALLPESPRFLAKDSTREPELRAMLKRVGRPVPMDARLRLGVASEGVAQGRRGQLVDLFREGFGRDTTALWIAFFLCLLAVYLAFNWLPSILTGNHFSSKEASQGLTLYNVGGIFGAIAVGAWITLKGSRLPMLVSASLAIVSALLIAGMVHLPTLSHHWLLGAILVQGLSVNAVQTTLYALATQLYPTRVRATGVAFALAIGRTGAIVSAYLGARLLSFQASTYFLLLALTMAGVWIALATLRRHIAAAELVTN